MAIRLGAACIAPGLGVPGPAGLPSGRKCRPPTRPTCWRRSADRSRAPDAMRTRRGRGVVPCSAACLRTPLMPTCPPSRPPAPSFSSACAQVERCMPRGAQHSFCEDHMSECCVCVCMYSTDGGGDDDAHTCHSHAPRERSPHAGRKEKGEVCAYMLEWPESSKGGLPQGCNKGQLAP